MIGPSGGGGLFGGCWVVGLLGWAVGLLGTLVLGLSGQVLSCWAFVGCWIGGCCVFWAFG